MKDNRILKTQQLTRHVFVLNEGFIALSYVIHSKCKRNTETSFAYMQNYVHRLFCSVD